MKVKWGALMVDGRGKIGGQVASKNRSGSYMRNKVTPSNPNTLAQVAVRNMLSTASSAWSGLTPAQRAGWDGAVKDWSTTNIFGDGVQPTGKNLFTKLNINLMNIDQSMINDVPVKSGVPEIVINTVVIDISGQTITVDPGLAEVGYWYLISATAEQSAGTSFFKGKFRNILSNANPSLVGSFIWDYYIAKFGVPSVGANIQFEFKLINITTGQAGLPITIKAEVVA